MGFYALIQSGTRAVFQFAGGALGAPQRGFFLKKKPLGSCGFTLQQLENRSGTFARGQACAHFIQTKECRG